MHALLTEFSCELHFSFSFSLVAFPYSNICYSHGAQECWVGLLSYLDWHHLLDVERKAITLQYSLVGWGVRGELLKGNIIKMLKSVFLEPQPDWDLWLKDRSCTNTFINMGSSWSSREKQDTWVGRYLSTAQGHRMFHQESQECGLDELISNHPWSRTLTLAGIA